MKEAACYGYYGAVCKSNGSSVNRFGLSQAFQSVYFQKLHTWHALKEAVTGSSTLTLQNV